MTSPGNLMPSELDALAIEVRKHLRQVAEEIYRAGRLLARAKELQEHGAWLQWIERETRLSDSTAENFIRTAAFIDARYHGEIPDGYDFAPSALYLLSRKSVPEVALEAADSLAADGLKITKRVAAQVIAAAVQAAEEVSAELMRTEGWVTIDEKQWNLKKVAALRRGATLNRLNEILGAQGEAIGRHITRRLAAHNTLVLCQHLDIQPIVAKDGLAMVISFDNLEHTPTTEAKGRYYATLTFVPDLPDEDAKKDKPHE